MIAAPEENLRSLCQFLELEFTSKMLAYHQRETKIVNVGREPWKARAVKSISQDPLTRWKTELSEQMVADIEAVAWPEMRRYGYKVQTNIHKLLPLTISAEIKCQFKYFLHRTHYYIEQTLKLMGNLRFLHRRLYGMKLFNF